ncbi:Leucine-rich repeat-containing protein 74, partial [Globisporangium splendens]
MKPSQRSRSPSKGGGHEATPDESDGHKQNASHAGGSAAEHHEQELLRRALQKQSHVVEHDLQKLHLTHRYDPKQLRTKVPWYRNSFEDTIPFTEITQEKSIEMDPPLVIPKELWPLGVKRRYLGSVQLIADTLPATHQGELARRAAASWREGDEEREAWRCENRQRGQVRFEEECGHEDEEDREELESADSVKVVHEQGDDDAVKEAEGDHQEAGRRKMRQRAHSGHFPTKPHSLDPLHASLTDSTVRDAHGDHHTQRRLARQLSLGEMEDLPNYKAYFGTSAKREFFAQYQNLYSRPYLFIESPDLVAQNNAIDTDAQPNTESNCIPAYPSSKELKKITHDLMPYGAGAAVGATSNVPSDTATRGNKGTSSNGLPTRDKLSPRSLFLTTCVTKPHLAVPFLLRKRMTKVFDFSFQSLGDEFVFEFAKCIAQGIPFVEEILVRDNRLSDAGLNALLEAISEGSSMLNLVGLDISQNEIGEKSAHTLRAYVASSHCTLQILHVENADIDDRECAAFMTAFEKNLSIKHLWMSRNCIGKLEHLNVVQPDFTTGGEAIASMLQKNLVLVHLDLSWNYLRLASSITLAHSIDENRTLTELSLSYNACGDAGAMMFGEALRFNQRLEVLDLSYNSIGCKGAMVLANAIRVSRTLRSLQLNGNNIGKEGGQLMLFALCDNQTEDGCDVGLHGCNLAAAVSSMGPIGSSASCAHTMGSAAMSGSAEVSLNALPLYTALSNQIFNPKEPAGRYVLNLSEAYDKMIVMELVRLARFKKGCRFLRIEHWASATVASVHPPPSSGKKSIVLIRKEQESPATLLQPTSHAATSSGVEEENNLETHGLDALFTNIDRDKSGSIDRKEVMRVLNRIGLFPQMDNLTSVLETYDYNRSGYLEEGEFSAFLFHAVFHMIDIDQSGKIDAEEMEDAFKMLGMHDYDQKEIAAAIATYDISGDGEIEESEFVEFMKDSLLEKIKLQIIAPMPPPPLSSSPPGKEAKLQYGGSSRQCEENVSVVLLDTATHKPWIVPDVGRVEIDFLYEREAFASNEEAHRQCKISQVGIEQLIRNITKQASSKSEQDELFHVAIHDSEIRFTAAQAYQVLEACGYMKPDEKKIEMIAMILLQMLTAKEAQVLVSRTLTIQQRCRLKAELGSAYSVMLGNPTAHYSFDLAKPKDRIALNKIAEVAQSEKLFSKYKSGRADTSQHDNWENFRNEELDGQKIVLTNAFFLVLPRHGKLSFDYVSTTRPKRGTTSMSARCFDQLIHELNASLDTRSGRKKNRHGIEGTQDKVDDGSGRDDGDDDEDETQARSDENTQNEQRKKTSLIQKHSSSSKQTEVWERTRSSVFKRRGAWQFVISKTSSKFVLMEATKENIGMKLVQIESAICDRWLSCDQAAQIIACMPTAFNARPETARILFSRLIDVNNFYRIYDALDSQEDQYMCAKMLGWLNICNPMVPERRYALDVSVRDEREMTKLLVELAITEPGENWINQSFSPAKGEPEIPGWKLPVRWEKEDDGSKDGKDSGGVNRTGYLEMEYYSGQDRGCAPVPAFRKTLLNRTLCGTKQYCL